MANLGLSCRLQIGELQIQILSASSSDTELTFRRKYRHMHVKNMSLCCVYYVEYRNKAFCVFSAFKFHVVSLKSAYIF